MLVVDGRSYCRPSSGSWKGPRSRAERIWSLRIQLLCSVADAPCPSSRNRVRESCRRSDRCGAALTERLQEAMQRTRTIANQAELVS